MIVYFADYSQAIAHLCVFLKQKYYYIIAVITAERESPHVEKLGKTLTIVLQLRCCPTVCGCVQNQASKITSF